MVLITTLLIWQICNEANYIHLFRFYCAPRRSLKVSFTSVLFLSLSCQSKSRIQTWMTMEEVPDRAELHRLRKEQERERRRLRDRQRRQSMSLEEREKHLARRRRNYQLRRQRAENAQLDPQNQLAVRGEMLVEKQCESVLAESDGLHFNDAAHVASDQRQDMLNLEHIKPESLEVSVHILPKFPGRLRFTRVKHLARTLHDPRGEPVGDNHGTATHPIKSDKASSNRIPSNGLRLNRVKQLARALSSGNKENADKRVDQSKTAA